MSRHQDPSSTPLLLREGQGLIGVTTIEDGQLATSFFIEDATDHDDEAHMATEIALGAIGSWADLDWDAAVEELDHIRHQSIPTPPLEL